MPEKLHVLFTTDNYDKVLYMILRLFFGKYDEDNRGKTNYRLSEFETQEAIIDAVSIASEGRHHPVQSAVAKSLSKLKEKILIYDGKEYQFGKINGYYRMVDSDDFIDLVRHKLTKWRPFLGESVFKSNINPNMPSTIYAFTVDTTNVNLSEVKQTFKTALGKSYFQFIEHGDTLFLLLNSNSKRIVADAKWLNDYFTNYNV